MSLGGLIGLSLNLDSGVASTFILKPKTQPSPETKPEIRIIFPAWEPLIPPGTIVLMHDGGGYRHQTVEALPTIIYTLKQQGYRFVTVPELLQIQ